MCSFLNRLFKPRPVRLLKDLGYAGLVLRKKKGYTQRRLVQAFRASLPQSYQSELGELEMSLETILIIVLVVFLLGGGGWYWRGRG